MPDSTCPDARASAPRDTIREAAFRIVRENAGESLGERDKVAPHIAELFCNMSDDGMAQFFVHVARILGEWSSHDCEMQLVYVAGHLVTCECSTPQARAWLHTLHGHLEAAEANPEDAHV